MGTPTASTANVDKEQKQEINPVLESKGIEFDWKSARYEAICTLALNGLLSNTAYNYMTTDQLVDKAIAVSKALEAKFATTPTPPEQEADV